MKRVLLVAALVLSTFSVSTTSVAAQSVVWVFGHSIAAGAGTSAGASWADRYAQLADVTIRNFAVGGAVLDLNGTNAAVLNDQVRAALAQHPSEMPDRVLIDIGTNDLVNHDVNTLTASKYAAIDVDVLLQQRGIQRAYWITILPIGYGSSHPDGWVSVLAERAQNWNDWLRAMRAQNAIDVADMNGVLHEQGNVITASWLEPDGLHPSNDAALLIAAALVAQTN